MNLLVFCERLLSSETYHIRTIVCVPYLFTVTFGNHPCDECHKSFTTPRGLEQHRTDKHSIIVQGCRGGNKTI